MNVMNANMEPTIEHGGTCKTYFMVPKESMREETTGSYLELVSEFEIAAGHALEAHYHDTHEFYYILKGEALMQIGDDKKVVHPGDLIHIPRNAVHSIRPTGSENMRAFCFAVSFMPEGGSGTEANPAVLPS